MKSKYLSGMVVGILVSLLLTVPVQAKEKSAGAGGLTQEQMAKMKEMGSPGPEHAVLNAAEGNWTVASRTWMKPGEKPERSSATGSMTWVLGGRFLRQDYKGEMMGQSFEGLGYLGYDRVRKEYTSVWFDNISTGIFQGTGQYDAATKTVAQTGTFSCPMTGIKDMWYRSEWKIVNDNKNIFTMFMKDSEGKEYRSMELVYKRVK